MIDFISKNKLNNNIAIIDDKNISYSYKKIHDDLSIFNFILEDKGTCFLETSNHYLPILFFIFCLKNKLVVFLFENLQNFDQLELVNEYKPKYIFSINPINKLNYILLFEIDNFFIYKCKILSKISPHRDIAFLMSTSGTMGNKKFVKISLKNILINSLQIKDYLKITKKSIAITTLPFNYSYGLSILFSHLISGAKVILNNDSVISRDFKIKINTYNVTNFGGVPYTYSLLNKINFFDKKFKSLKYVTQAGGMISDYDKNILISQSKEFKFSFIIMYGQTEASPRISYLPYKDIIQKHRSIGIPVKNGKIFIHNKNNKIIIKPFIEGELIYQGENVSLGYVSNEKDLVKGDENFGILKTGDRGYFDDDNYFYLTGRSNRLAKIFGKRINLDDIQKLINKKYVAICLSDDCKLIIYVEQCDLINDLITDIVNYTGINKNFILVRQVIKLQRSNSGKLLIKYYKNAK